MAEKQDYTHNKAHTHDGHEKPHSHTHSHTQTKAVLNRLSRAIGHLTAVRTMVENGRDCSEVLTQLAAVRSAVNKTSEVILKDHLDHCIIYAAEKGDMKAIKELNKAIELFMK
ncbi:MAG: metal-sensing transcriptional repressor [Oscillospiraceae bacterium]|nr:metal-sensing transcriptional repressor [Oscillospiraceae bacterium]